MDNVSHALEAALLSDAVSEAVALLEALATLLVSRGCDWSTWELLGLAFNALTGRPLQEPPAPASAWGAPHPRLSV